MHDAALHSFQNPAARHSEKGAPNGTPLLVCTVLRLQLPVALDTSTETPGPMVELIETFCM
jgi:hypothetical protein